MIKSKLVFFGIVLFTTACGSESRNLRTGDDDVPSAPRISASKPVVVRGTYQTVVSSGEAGSGLLLLGTRAAEDTPAVVSVAAAVRFNVNDDAFDAPTDAEEETESFGNLAVDRLRDNQLRVCGPSGDSPCAVAALRIYTKGKPGAGMWNDVEGYGIPIYSAGQTIGLGQTGALTLSSKSLTGIRVLNLNHFASSGDFLIPIEVAFADAAAGSYQTTLVVEYVLQ